MPGDPKARLLAAVIDELTEHGLGEGSLRALATAVGTSHRMLIYHFGSKEGLLIEIVRTMEQRQRAALTDLERELETDPSSGYAKLRDGFGAPRNPARLQTLKLETAEG